MLTRKLQNLKGGLHYTPIGQHWPRGQNEPDIKDRFWLNKNSKRKEKEDLRVAHGSEVTRWAGVQALGIDQPLSTLLKRPSSMTS